MSEPTNLAVHRLRRERPYSGEATAVNRPPRAKTCSERTFRPPVHRRRSPTVVLPLPGLGEEVAHAASSEAASPGAAAALERQPAGSHRPAAAAAPDPLRHLGDHPRVRRHRRPDPLQRRRVERRISRHGIARGRLHRARSRRQRAASTSRASTRRSSTTRRRRRTAATTSRRRSGTSTRPPPIRFRSCTTRSTAA